MAMSFVSCWLWRRMRSGRLDLFLVVPDLGRFLLYPCIPWVATRCRYHTQSDGVERIVATTTMVVVAASVVGGRGYGSTSVFGPVVEEE